ncbi:MAG: hypothetical protein ABIU05_25425 [Nitrospirales bacterium]
MSSYNLRNHVAFALSPHVESKATMMRGDVPRADLSGAPRDEPEHVPGSAGTAEAMGCGSNARPRVETPANQNTDVVRGSDKAIPHGSRTVSADGETAHRAGSF